LSIQATIEDEHVVITNSSILTISILFHFWTGGPGTANGELAVWITTVPGVQLDKLLNSVQIASPTTGPTFSIDEDTPPGRFPLKGIDRSGEEWVIKSGPIVNSGVGSILLL
jgi:hypothetical protein